MKDKLNESLSALMDNEADELELRRILKEMESTSDAGDEIADELKNSWYRYHVVSASLKKEIHSSPSCNLLARIQAELEDDVTPIANPVMQSGSGKGLLKLVGQGAIAASVALAVLFTADLVMETGNGSGAGLTAELAGSSADNGLLPGLTGQLNPATETRFAVQTGLAEEEMSRLEQVVSEELEDSLETLEVPATFIPEETP